MKEMGFTHESTHNESQEWYTPPEIFTALRLTFDMDVASPGASVVPWIPAAKHLTIAENGLTTPWEGRVWLNPPYGQDTPLWASRFGQYLGSGVLLVFARPDTRWFQDNAKTWDAILFVRGRIKFIRADGFRGQGCGAASMLVAKGDECVYALQHSDLGFFIDLRRTP